MEIKPRKSMLRLAPAAAGFTLAGILPLLVAAQAQAVEFSFAEEEVTGALDTTVSYGQLWRVKGQTEDSINGNDGNRNFDTGLVSEVYKITSELSANYKNYGAFVRGTAHYDTQIMDKRSDYYDNNNPSQPSQAYPNDNYWTDDTRHIAGRSGEILDAYVYGDWDVANMPLNIKAGKQVFNWGESLFYRGGISASNPVDAAAFRLPGSELKEVLVPTMAVGFNLGVTEDFSVEGYVQTEWQETAQDPVGTFYSTDDLFSPGAQTAYDNFAGTGLDTLMPLYASGVMIGAGGLVGNNFIYPYNTADNSIMRVASIGDDIEARDGGQWGFNMKYVVEEWNSTEFGLYFLNYHTKEPNINANFGGYTVKPGALGCGIGPAGCAGLFTIDLLGSTTAQREYVEDVRLYGLSFSTTVEETSVFGELAYRPNMPIGVSTSDDILADTTQQAVLINGAVPGLVLGGNAQIGGQTVNLASNYSNYTRVEMFNASLGTIHNFGPSLGFDSLFTVAEVAAEAYRADSLQYTAWDGTNRYYSSAQNAEYIDVSNNRDNQINRNAYGYTLVAQGTWNDVFAGVNLSPYVAWSHDVEGNSHQAGQFVENNKAYTLGLEAIYLNSLQAEIAYTDFFGSDNGLTDRDNIGLNVKYSF